MKKILFGSAVFSGLLTLLFFALLVSCKKQADKSIPAVSIVSVNSITKTTASSGGEVTSDGGTEVTARGVCWSVNQNPTTTDKKTTDGTGLGSFTSSITGLTPGATYNIRAYAINSSGTAYSSSSAFKALPTTPTLTTTLPSAVRITSATSGGNISDDGGSGVTTRGICWSLTVNPTILNTKTADGTGSGAFSSSLTNLVANTTYYVRAYATNSEGTSYGNEIVLKTFTGTVTDIVGNVYSTVTIGTQVWMAENLKTNKYNDNTSIPYVTDAVTWSALTTPGYCWYNNDEASYKGTYGTLYNWYSVDESSNGGKNICPTGWRVPNDAQLTSLTASLGGESGAGGKLKESGTTHWLSPNTGATNESGFTALPAGSRGATYLENGSSTNFWSSTQYETGSSWNIFISYSNSNAHRGFSGKQNGFSVRCIKN